MELYLLGFGLCFVMIIIHDFIYKKLAIKYPDDKIYQDRIGISHGLLMSFTSWFGFIAMTFAVLMWLGELEKVCGKKQRKKE